jgi:hypothetical protein
MAPVPASARDDVAVEGTLIERMVSATVTVTADGVTVSEPSGFERRRDGAEHPLALGSSGEGAFGCRGTGDARHLGDIRLAGGGSGGLFSLYSLPGQPQDTTQVLICLAGGARAGKDERLLQAGVGAAYEGDESRKLGMRWLTGPTPPRGEDGWFFAGSRTAGADGFIEQAPADHLEGSFIGPFDSDFDDHFRNAAAGWWEDDCVDAEQGCRHTDGSRAFQGSLAGALWEFPASEESHRFQVALFWATREHGEGRPSP